MNNIAAAIEQVEAEIAKIDADFANQPAEWDNRAGTTNLPMKLAMNRKHSLLLAIDRLKAAQ